jgi:hypothetical protein
MTVNRTRRNREDASFGDVCGSRSSPRMDQVPLGGRRERLDDLFSASFVQLLAGRRRLAHVLELLASTRCLLVAREVVAFFSRTVLLFAARTCTGLLRVRKPDQALGSGRRPVCSETAVCGHRTSSKVV